MLFVAAAVPALGLELRVAPDGNDSWNGRSAVRGAGNDGPFATLERARDEVRAIKADGAPPPGGVRVVVAPGRYVLDRPLLLGEGDSGTAAAPVVYEGLETGAVRLLGGRIISGFEQVTAPEVLSRLDEPARENVYAANLREQGITDYGEASGGGLELFYDGEPMQISRWPNEGFVKIVDVTGGEEVDIRGTKGDRIGKWIYEGARPSRWLDEKDAWLYGYWFWDWSAEHQKVKRIDPQTNTIEIEEPYHGYGYRKGQWYYALNLLSEIDSPGEWYLDREEGRLYFWPPKPIDEAEVIVSLLSTAIELNNVSHCTFRGLMIEGCRRAVVRVIGGESNRIVACTIRNSGAEAITVSGGRDHGIIGCDIYDVGGGGISLDGGERETLTAAGHHAVNNHIYDYARWYRMYHPAITLRGVGQRVANNLIHDAPHIAVLFGGNDHLIEYNEIYNVCYESNDAGAIYAGRDWTERGTVIRHNFLHNILGYEDRGCVGVYLDDMFCGTEISGNLFYRVYRAAFIGGGRDNAIVNNLFVDCPKALHVDARAMNWAADTVDTTMTDRLNAMPSTDPIWRERFAELLTILEDEPAAPKGNRIERNVFVGEDWNDVAADARPYVELNGNLALDDPSWETPARFEDDPTPDPTQFRLNPKDQPPGFEPLPLEKMRLDRRGIR